MVSVDLMPLTPLIVVAVTAVLLMLWIAFVRDHTSALVLALVGLAVAILTLFTGGTGAQQVTRLLVIDGYARLYMGLLFAATMAVMLLSFGYLREQTAQREEFYLLLLLAALGSAVMACSTHFASFFLGLEILSVSLYALIAYPRTRQLSVEASIKYLVLAGTSSAFLLFGMALVYAETGSMEVSALAAVRQPGAGVSLPILLAGVAGMIIGIGFKLGLVPFHMWSPDVYEGAPAPVTAFIASVSKGGTFALLLRYFAAVDVPSVPALYAIFAVVAIASMLIGNLMALLQSNVKRILAYSSIAHLGYLMVAFLAGGQAGIAAGTFYLVAYFVTIIAAFGVVTLLSGRGGDASEIADYRGLFWRRPWSAAVLSAALLSLAGLPLTAGFVGKFGIVMAGIGAARWLLVIVLVAGSAISLYYYLKIIVAMYLGAEEAEPGRLARMPVPALTWAGGLALAVLAVLVVWLGVYPGPLVELIGRVAGI